VIIMTEIMKKILTNKQAREKALVKSLLIKTAGEQMKAWAR